MVKLVSFSCPSPDHCKINLALKKNEAWHLLTTQSARLLSASSVVVLAQFPGVLGWNKLHAPARVSPK
jgi:hypothetical protein